MKHTYKPSWTKVTIALGVIAALAIASPVFGLSSSIKKAIKKQVSKQVSKQVAKARGPAGPPGMDGTARAYGRVAGPGTLTRSKNIASVGKPNPGAYCITPAGGIDVSTAVVIVGRDYLGNSTDDLEENISHVEWNSDPDFCAVGQLEVLTFVYNGDATDDDDGGGNSTGDDLVAGDQAFAFVIP